MGGLPNERIPIPTYPKQKDRKSATTDWAHHVGSSSGLITIVVMTLLRIWTKTACGSNIRYAKPHQFVGFLLLFWTIISIPYPAAAYSNLSVSCWSCLSLSQYRYQERTSSCNPTLIQWRSEVRNPSNVFLSIFSTKTLNNTGIYSYEYPGFISYGLLFTKRTYIWWGSVRKDSWWDECRLRSARCRKEVDMIGSGAEQVDAWGKWLLLKQVDDDDSGCRVLIRDDGRSDDDR